MSRTVRLALLLVLAWQAGLSVLDFARHVRARSGVPLAERLFASRDDRFRRALGRDAAVLFALRRHLPADAILLTRTAETVTESALVQSLRHALYPVWVIEMPRSMLSGELSEAGGRPAWFLDLDGGGPPSRQWTAPRAAGRFRFFVHRDARSG